MELKIPRLLYAVLREIRQLRKIPTIGGSGVGVVSCLNHYNWSLCVSATDTQRVPDAKGVTLSMNQSTSYVRGT